MSDVQKRKRKIDVEKLTTQQADQLSAQIGKEIAKIMDEANTKCNELLSIYGLETQIGYEVKPKNKKESKQQSL